jgi:hypothetical protein
LIIRRIGADRRCLEPCATSLADRIAATPYLTLFPASLEDPQVAGPPRVHRFRDPAADPVGVPPPPTGPAIRRLLRLS